LALSPYGRSRPLVLDIDLRYDRDCLPPGAVAAIRADVEDVDAHDGVCAELT
jgi:hypothetical protein